MDSSQNGNLKRISIQHYPIHLIDRIMSGLDNNLKGGTHAVSLHLTINRPSADSATGLVCSHLQKMNSGLISLNHDYFFQGLKGKMSGFGAKGSVICNCEYLCQTNSNADCVLTEDRWKFVDDLSSINNCRLNRCWPSQFLQFPAACSIGYLHPCPLCGPQKSEN